MAPTEPTGVEIIEGGIVLLVIVIFALHVIVWCAGWLFGSLKKSLDKGYREGTSDD